MEKASRKATYEDLASLSDQARGEVIAGQVVVSPALLPRHARVQRTLGRFVGGPFDDDHDLGGPGGWWILPEVDVALTQHDIVRPDLSGWKRSRLTNPWDTRPLVVRPD